MRKESQVKILQASGSAFGSQKGFILSSIWSRPFGIPLFRAEISLSVLRSFRNMLADPRCLIFLGLSGAMIPGGMRRVIRDMIEMKLVDVIVSTGANIFHDLFESFGYRHYIGNERRKR